MVMLCWFSTKVNYIFSHKPVEYQGNSLVWLCKQNQEALSYFHQKVLTLLSLGSRLPQLQTKYFNRIRAA